MLAFASLVITGALMGASGQAQAPVLCIGLRIDIPQDDGITREIRTPEGRATASLMLRHSEDDYRLFLLDLTVREAASELVHIAIRTDRDREDAIDEFDLRAGEGSIQAATAPPFSLAVLRVFERTGYSCQDK